MKTRIAESWLSFKAAVIPDDASPVQVTECRRAFYAGAISLFYALNNDISTSPEMTEADMQIMVDLDAEIEAWRAALREGRA